MNVENLSITVPDGYDPANPITVVIREGQAETINEPVQFKRGNIAIGSVVDFVTFTERNSEDAARDLRSLGVFIYCIDPERPSLQFYADPTNRLAFEIGAALKLDPGFEAFGINSGRKFDQKSLENLIRTQAHCFATTEVAKGLIKDLRNFEVKYEQLVEKEDDRRGQKGDKYSEALKFTKGEMPAEFHLSLPIWKHTPKAELVVEIEIDKGPGNMPVFSFYSLEAETLKRSIAEETILAEVNAVKDRFAVLEV